MREYAALIGSMAALLALIATSVFALHDRNTLVSPAEAVGEDFVRALTTGRYDVALKYVDPRAGFSREEIRSWSEQIRSRGAIQSVDVKPLSGDAQRAVTEYTVTLVSREEMTGELRLIFDRGWRVTR